MVSGEIVVCYFELHLAWHQGAIRCYSSGWESLLV